MERVAFLVEATGERIGCLLNPETVVVRRSAGLRARRTAGGLLTGARLSDDPLVSTGGGRTELELELLFDVTLGGSTVTTDNVQDLTRPLWSLSENAESSDAFGAVRPVRFVWGKTWNIPVVVAATAHPAKFPDAVERATGRRPPLPARLADLYDREERFAVLPPDLAAVQRLR